MFFYFSDITEILNDKNFIVNRHFTFGFLHCIFCKYSLLSRQSRKARKKRAKTQNPLSFLFKLCDFIRKSVLLRALFRYGKKRVRAENVAVHAKIETAVVVIDNHFYAFHAKPVPVAVLFRRDRQIAVEHHFLGV